jgi:outer membrane protein W
MIHTTMDMTYKDNLTHVHANVDLNPWMVGLGIAYRF